MASPDYRRLLRRIRPLDRVALGIVIVFLLVAVIQAAGYTVPLAGIVQFAFFITLGYLIYRFFAWARTKLLWSLRNRLIVAFLFFAGVPVVMLLAMGAITARMLFQQLGGYLLVQDIQSRITEVANAADSVASALAMEPPPQAKNAGPMVPAVLQAHLVRVEADLPGLELDLKSAGKYLASSAASSGNRFAGIVQSQDQLWLVGEVRRGQSTVTARAPVTPELLDRIGSFLGSIQMVMTHPATNEDPPNTVLHIGGLRYGAGRRHRDFPAKVTAFQLLDGFPGGWRVKPRRAARNSTRSHSEPGLRFVLDAGFTIVRRSLQFVGRSQQLLPGGVDRRSVCLFASRVCGVYHRHRLDAHDYAFRVRAL